MKREAKLLLGKACDALVLSIEIFNRPHDRGRVCGALIQLDHGFEMLLKAAIRHRGGRICERCASRDHPVRLVGITRAIAHGPDVAPGPLAAEHG